MSFVVMLITRFICGLNKCYRFSCCSQKLNLFLHNNMDSTKRQNEDSHSEDAEVSKKLKTDNEVLNKVFENSNRVRKPKKIVLLLSYLGKDFYGLQRNQNVNTVEEELLKALLKANIILEDEFNHPKTMKFQRAARTDKGVSAVRNIVSLKIPIKEICETLPQKINQYLPPEVRVVAYKRVTQAFDAKIACDARTYSYMLPTFAFAPNVEGSSEEYRITDERVQEVNVFLKSFLGTHNYYNFTSGRLPGDPSCKRYMMSCECSSPFESSGIEFTVIQVKGQSFMLHQIRKMVGLAIAYMRNLTGEDILKKTWENERIDIPKAPGLGLMLEELHYDWYDTKYGSDGIHEPLKWDQYKDVIETFKKEKICANIAKTEREEKSMLQWLQTLPHHSYDVRDAGPPSMLPPKLVQANQQNALNVISTDVVDKETELVKDCDKASELVNAGEKVTELVEENEKISMNIDISDVNSDLSRKINESEIKCES
ncbi:pseudouridylate synthase 1 homolog isoform X2 [Parasteatoda tepidariorum]|uniref:pseudouridylate synthase 1 homolog isoform X2 n=2 Tax=Parasteatoda tepidariorum TaxID=114398 RepID=UPI001C7261B8|nr:tRNA pseudouridine synthase A isoform X2 [Parasteatoda tepidariorum]